MPYHDLEELRRSSKGRWTEILISAGMPAECLDGRNHPCPKCGGRDRFAAFGDLPLRGAVHCRHCFTRGSNLPPSDGIATLRWWMDVSFVEALSYLAEQLAIGATLIRSSPSRRSWRGGQNASGEVLAISQREVDAHTQFARQAYRRIDRETRQRLAKRLDVSAASLTSLRVGITTDGRCSTWPMRNENGDVIGVRISGLPWTDARHAKWSRKGSQSGIFLPQETFDDNHLYLTEGASDTAAAISLGLRSIGRACCSSSTHFIERYLINHSPERITLIADNDSAGRIGATRLLRSLKKALPNTSQPIEIIVPPGESTDLRAWVGQGATRSEIMRATPIALRTESRQPTFEFG